MTRGDYIDGRRSRTARHRLGLIAVVVALALPNLAAAQVRAPAPQFRLNAVFPDEQERPVLAADGLGRFVGVWWGQRPGGFDNTVLMRRVSRRGALTGEIVAGRFERHKLKQATVASSTTGQTAVVWVESENLTNEDLFRSSVWMSVFDSDLALVRELIPVSTTPAQLVDSSAAAVLDDGRTMVAWSFNGLGVDRSTRRTVARLFDSSGQPLSEEIPIGDADVATRGVFATTARGGDEFLVGWTESHAEGGLFRVGRYDRNGELCRPALAFDSGAGGFHLASGEDGQFLALWLDADDDAGGRFTGLGVFARAFGADDKPLGPARLVNEYLPGYQYLASVVSDGVGGYFAAWTSNLRLDDEFGQDGSSTGVFGRRLRADGSPHGRELQINTITELQQGLLGARVSLASHKGKVLVAWSDGRSDPLPEHGLGIGARWLRVRPSLSALCGDAHAQDLRRSATDALKILRAVVDSSRCIPCLCDADNFGEVTASDALRVLRRVVGVKERLHCPVCADDDFSPAGEPVVPDLN